MCIRDRDRCYNFINCTYRNGGVVMDPIILSILPMVVGLILGFILCVIVNYFRENNTSKRIEELLTKAKKEAEKAKRESILETKEEIHKLKLDYEKELKEKKAELKDSEERLICLLYTS